jgi:acylphosphatase
MSVSSTSTVAIRFYGIGVAVRRRVRAHGRVQGVFFRDSVRREAARRGVAGWARNCGDGTVEAVFEGEPEAVDALVELCRSGPGHASVERLDVEDEEPEGLAKFDVG